LTKSSKTGLTRKAFPVLHEDLLKHTLFSTPKNPNIASLLMGDPKPFPGARSLEKEPQADTEVRLLVSQMREELFEVQISQAF
jgi:hypothetical protein